MNLQTEAWTSISPAEIGMVGSSRHYRAADIVQSFRADVSCLGDCAPLDEPRRFSRQKISMAGLTGLWRRKPPRAGEATLGDDRLYVRSWG
jgi:hypothetical protein